MCYLATTPTGNTSVLAVLVTFGRKRPRVFMCAFGYADRQSAGACALVERAVHDEGGGEGAILLFFARLFFEFTAACSRYKLIMPFLFYGPFCGGYLFSLDVSLPECLLVGAGGCGSGLRYQPVFLRFECLFGLREALSRGGNIVPDHPRHNAHPGKARVV